MRKPVVRIGLIAIVVALAVVPINGRSIVERGFDFVATDCTVGLYGAAVSVTIEGGGSDACDAWVRSDPAHPWYRYSGGTEPAGAVICQNHSNGMAYTVRDQGVLNAYGSSVCDSFVRQATADILRRLADSVIASQSPNGGEADNASDAAPPGPDPCGFRLVGHDLTVTVYGVDCDGFSGRLPHQGIGWKGFDPMMTDGGPSDGRQICAGYLFEAYAEVVDTGGAIYATDVCDLVAVPTSPMD